MNKATKGALAAAAGVAILAGGAGTMAAWNDSSSLGSGTVTAGSLNIVQTGQGTWHWGSPQGQPFNPATDRLVPGDTVVYVGEYTITAHGQNLTATLTPSLGGVDGDLAPFLVAAPVGDGGGVITPGTHVKTIGTAVTFKSDTSGEDGQNLEADLSGGTITLQQTVS